ncbi:P1 family peptidase, partial [Streptomyces sp. NPDC050264]|uniref:P1 family peptidase n=1 Tax=Streptomyces sp. NPDC050264 TaxID=3155038 RepID=UPI0034225EEB
MLVLSVGASLAAIVAPPWQCSILVATDAPADARRLRRITRRTTVGPARTGGGVQQGSGEYAPARQPTTSLAGTPVSGSPGAARHEAE